MDIKSRYKVGHMVVFAGAPHTVVGVRISAQLGAHYELKRAGCKEHIVAHECQLIAYNGDPKPKQETPNG